MTYAFHLGEKLSYKSVI